tara:strand:+ start:1005 stop:1178 length:174 start_codon:yes stop_codon:yes gene_type:complete
MNKRYKSLRERVALIELNTVLLERLEQILEGIRYEILKVELRDLQAHKWIEETNNSK